jgi:cell division protein YceG involved in septum cleavage
LARDRKSEASAQRTEAERERAREERERRRAATAGNAVPPLPPPAAEPVEVVAPVVPAQITPPVQAPPPTDAPVEVQDDPVVPPRLEGRRTHRAHLNRPHVHRPHLHRPHLPRRASKVKTGAARAGALLAIAVVLALLAGAAVVLIHRANRPAPPPAPKIVNVVIPEGYTEEQIATLAKEDGLHGDYSKAVAHAERTGLLRPSTYGAPSGTRSLEGFLFPASYELYSGTPVSHLVSQQLDAFRSNFGGGEVHRAKVLGVTPYDLLIVASIIEREAGTAHDRPLVAAVIYNRLRLNMTLGVDATLRYALHDFTHPLTEHELASKSAYNTRIHKGLPPTPISNPGAAAIHAAGHPAHVSYLYYVAGADGCGEQVFSTSYAKFEQDAAAYREALRKNGGRVPTCHKK